MVSSELSVRMRRLRCHPRLRDLMQEVSLTVHDFVLPLFVIAGNNIKNPITSMPGHFQFSVDRLDEEIHSIVALGLPAVMLFGIPAYKDSSGTAAIKPEGVVQQALQRIKAIAPELLVMVDLCFCEYTDHGHCGVLRTDTYFGPVVDNDATLLLLSQQALSLVEAGADVIAPSGMLDGMVKVLRQSLDSHGYTHIPILSYAVKYASSFYGPFRDAAEGSPMQGDRQNHQMDYANLSQAFREVQLDIDEGADMLMVKPAMNYLDVISKIKAQYPVMPLAAYQVSGEYAMIKSAAERGWLDERSAMLESLISIKRAGANFIISYFSKSFAQYSKNRSAIG